MRYLVLAISALFTISCGEGETAGVQAKIGWTFNYAAWASSTTQPDDLRNCSNVPDQLTGPAYDQITKVRVRLDDPNQQVRGFSESYNCTAGYSKKVNIKGLEVQKYILSMVATNANGDALYRYDEENYNLADSRSDIFEMVAASGEIRFFPSFPGVNYGACPPSGDTLRYSFYEQGSDTPAYTGTMDLCFYNQVSQMDEVDIVNIRNIPSQPTEGTNGNYNPEMYTMVLEVIEGDAVHYCYQEANRGIKPGNDNLNNDITFVAGECI